MQHRRRRAARRRRERRAPPPPTRPSPGCCAAATGRCCSPRPRSTTSGSTADVAALWRLGLGEPYPVQRPARPRLGRPARRDPGGAAREPARHVRRRQRRPAPGGAGRQAERRQVQPAQPGVGGDPLGGARRRRHDRRPGRLAGRAGRRGVAVRRHRGPAQAGQHRQRHGVLRVACAPARRSRPPRWRSCWSTPREPHRRAGPAGDQHGRGGRAGRWCWRSTSGTSSTRTGGWR